MIHFVDLTDESNRKCAHGFIAVCGREIPTFDSLLTLESWDNLETCPACAMIKLTLNPSGYFWKRSD
jgi:hypothetical protein